MKPCKHRQTIVGRDARRLGIAPFLMWRHDACRLGTAPFLVWRRDTPKRGGASRPTKHT